MESKYTGVGTIILSIFLFSVISFLFFPCCAASDYYADLEITVDSSGFVTIDGVTNHPQLLVQNTELYISKQQSFWLLNITKNETFSDFVFLLTLPEGSSINYVKSSGAVFITQELGNLVLEGYGENESFSLAVQYKTEKILEDEKILGLDYFTFFLIIIIIILIVLFVFVLFFTDEKKQEPKKVQEINLRGLNDRQKQIIKLLMDVKRPLTQTEIQRELKIPKAAVSRNISTLERKGLIEKEQIGMSNRISLKKQ
jgi:uncharacterized membrane protein